MYIQNKIMRTLLIKFMNWYFKGLEKHFYQVKEYKDSLIFKELKVEQDFRKILKYESKLSETEKEKFIGCTKEEIINSYIKK